MEDAGGRRDAVVSDLQPPDIVGVLEQHFGTEDYGIGTRKEDTELMAKIEKAMDEMKKDGSAAAISTKWFGKDIIKP